MSSELPLPYAGRAQRRPILMAALVVASLLAVSAAPQRAVGQKQGATLEVKIFAPRGDPGARCDRVLPLRRTVSAPRVLTGALQQLLRGPTAAEQQRGYRGWFSSRTARMLRSVRINAGVAYVDFADFSRIIPNASSSCGSALLLAQLDRTATQFPTVRRAIYSFKGSRSAFYEWLQRSAPSG